MLNVTFDPDQRPETQHQLRAIPPSSVVDYPKLREAIERYEHARADEMTKRRTAIDAEQKLPEAENADALALADAQTAGKADPGDKHRQKALAEIAEARRQHAASKIVLARSIDAVSEAFAEHGAEWEAHLVAERDELRAEAEKVLDVFEATWRQVQRTVANLAVARGNIAQEPSLFASSFRAPMVRDGNVVQVADVLQGLRDLAKPEPPKDPEPARHAPPSSGPFASTGSQTVQLG